MRVAVIGAGPSGLTTLKHLTQARKHLDCQEVEARLFEYQPHVGGTFVARVYEDAELVSSKQLTTFSDFRLPDAPDFLSAAAYARYLRSYCTHFDLWPCIHLNSRVVAVVRRPNGHKVVYRCGDDEHEWDCDAVAVCSGLHVEPNMPAIDGLGNVPRVIHSSEFKSRKQFRNRRTVMVVGSGETGADISYLAVTTPTVERVVLCHRDGFHFAPKRNPGPVILPGLRKPDPFEPGIPIDVSRANLFDTAYVHKILRSNDKLLWGYYNLYIKIILFICSGTTLGMDQWVGEISRERDHPSKIFFNKSMKVCPYISQPYRPQLPGPRLWLYALRSAFVQTPIPDTQGRRVDLAPWPKRIDKSGSVEFVDNRRPEYTRLQGQRIRPDLVVLCTGYKQSFPFLTSGFRNSADLPYPTPNSADVRHIWSRRDPSVGFIGFVRPSLGAIPPLAELQAQLWVCRLLSPQSIPRPLSAQDEHHYKLRPVPGARITYGVDHESYAYQLALDMGSAPGLWDIAGFFSWRSAGSSWRLLLIWALGAQLNTKFRLKGPWKWQGAFEVLTSDEMWQTITRRPIIFGHFAVSMLPICIFGPINLLCWVYGASAALLSEPYASHPLNATADGIRVVTVHPHLSPDGLVACRLQTVTFAQRPQYETLSYRWGHGECPPRTVLVDGVALGVTGNLHDALHYLRAHPRRSAIWIDAISINQDDVAERSSQLRIMPHIYARATATLVWLGRRYVNLPPLDLDLDLGPAEEAEPNADIRDWVVSDAYWDRVWILQEIAKARRIRVCFGREPVEWEAFMSWLRRHHRDGVDGTAGPFKLDGLRRDKHRGSCSLAQLLTNHAGALARDPRDKIYGLVGLSTDGRGFPMDYGKTLLQVWCDTVHFMSRHDLLPQDTAERVRFCETVRDLLGGEQELGSVSGVVQLYSDPRRHQPFPDDGNKASSASDEMALSGLSFFSECYGVIVSLGPSASEILSSIQVTDRWEAELQRLYRGDLDSAHHENDNLLRAIFDSHGANGQLVGLSALQAHSIGFRGPELYGSCWSFMHKERGAAPGLDEAWVHDTTTPHEPRLAMLNLSPNPRFHTPFKLAFVSPQARQGDFICRVDGYPMKRVVVRPAEEEHSNDVRMHVCGTAVMVKDVLSGGVFDDDHVQSSFKLDVVMDARTLYALIFGNEGHGGLDARVDMDYDGVRRVVAASLGPRT
ncbi:uncharacterized protein UV8b_04266 [Ustilaginoidea virens]|uniref:Heterokaryon incompatibility domain-containing protein n=1 Tax=Ustilaginoidea virens TaxID=1159556 RepID=A0A8E5HRH4_USTVR|nr:uncharacterized protein UV8b_04266 [Ustilaginoidea virens]QUC20025.1 hypothetical protein UV8b_04266 [Ustilaginoidea virens]